MKRRLLRPSRWYGIIAALLFDPLPARRRRYSLLNLHGVLAVLFGLSMIVSAQKQVIPVWPGVAPGSENWTQKEVEYLNPQKQTMIRNVVRPTMTAFMPDRSKANGTAVIVCPGGGFRFLSWQSEGTEVAQWLRDRGVAAFVLKYRLLDTGATEAEFQKALAELFSMISRISSGDSSTPAINDIAMQNIITMAATDGKQAIKVVREHASEWGIALDRVGIMGFSAGGLLTDEVALHHDAESRPDFVAPIYGAPFAQVSVPPDAPPMFILCANDDPLASSGSARLFSEWKAAGKAVELHVYSKGGHGFGMNKQGLPADHWIDRFSDWLEVQGLLKPTH